MAEAPYVLMGYQKRFWCDESPVIVWKKSRRIGASWACAGKAVELAATNKLDTYYVSYSEDSGKDFIRDVAQWAKWYQVAHSTTAILENFEGGEGGESESILVNRVEFANGRRVSALSSRPRSFRGKTGLAIIDEAAFVDDLPAFIKAVMAFRTWGGRVIILSSHNGEANPFNELCLDIKAGKRNYSLHRTTIDDALRDGLYKRISYMAKEPWTADGEAQWRSQLINDYGIDADEELFCVPRSNAGAVFHREWFRIIDAPPCRITRTVRAYDFASTAVGKNKRPDWTRGLKGSVLEDGSILLSDLVSLQGQPAAVKRLLLDTAGVDGPRVDIAIWTDPGQAGVYQTDDIVTTLAGYSVLPERAAKNKVDYARPVASFAKNGKVSMLRAPWNDEFLREISAFPSPHAHDDIIDALSRLFMALTGVRFAIGYDGVDEDRHGEHAHRSMWDDDNDNAPSYAGGGYF